VGTTNTHLMIVLLLTCQGLPEYLFRGSYSYQQNTMTLSDCVGIPVVSWSCIVVCKSLVSKYTEFWLVNFRFPSAVCWQAS